MENVIIQLDNVYFQYDKTKMILEDVSFTVKKGEFVGIIGPNGGGKTTLLKLMLGLLTPTSGNVSLYNRTTKEKTKNSKIGYVPQEKMYNYGFPISVMEVVLMGRLSKKKLLSLYNKNDKTIAKQCLNKVGMLDFADKQMQYLSGGQKQRVYIARALASEPNILLLDEPTTGIDPKFHHEFYELINELNKDNTVISVSHDLECLSKNVSKIVYVNKKVNVKSGTELKDVNFHELYHTL